MKGQGYYSLQCVGGPFDGRVIRYPDLPAVLVLMTRAFSYHHYERQGETDVYAYRSTTTEERADHDHDHES